MSIRRYTTSAWKPAAFAVSTVVFLAAMIACAERGWHAPRQEVLVPLFAFGILSGLAVSALRARSRALGFAAADDDAIVEVTSARPSTYARAAIAAVGTSLVSGVALGLAMGPWTQLFLASLLGALYMATWPLQVVAAHAVFAGRITIGIDGVRVGRRHLPFHTLARVTVDARDAALVLEPHHGAVVRHRCADLEAARDLRARIEERLASRTAFDAATLRMRDHAGSRVADPRLRGRRPRRARRRRAGDRRTRRRRRARARAHADPRRGRRVCRSSAARRARTRGGGHARRRGARGARAATGEARHAAARLTAGLTRPFSEEAHPRPSPPPSYARGRGLRQAPGHAAQSSP